MGGGNKHRAEPVKDERKLAIEEDGQAEHPSETLVPIIDFDWQDTEHAAALPWDTEATIGKIPMATADLTGDELREQLLTPENRDVKSSCTPEKAAQPMPEDTHAPAPHIYDEQMPAVIVNSAVADIGDKNARLLSPREQQPPAPPASIASAGHEHDLESGPASPRSPNPIASVRSQHGADDAQENECNVFLRWVPLGASAPDLLAALQTEFGRDAVVCAQREDGRRCGTALFRSAVDAEACVARGKFALGDSEVLVSRFEHKEKVPRRKSRHNRGKKKKHQINIASGSTEKIDSPSSRVRSFPRRRRRHRSGRNSAAPARDDAARDEPLARRDVQQQRVQPASRDGVASAEPLGARLFVDEAAPRPAQQAAASQRGSGDQLQPHSDAQDAQEELDGENHQEVDCAANDSEENDDFELDDGLLMSLDAIVDGNLW